MKRRIPLTDEERRRRANESRKRAYRRDPQKYLDATHRTWLNKAKMLHEDPSLVSNEQLEQEARELRREYMREWAKKNPEKIEAQLQRKRMREYMSVVGGKNG